MVVLLCRYGGRVTCSDGVKNYVNGNVAITRTSKDINLLQLKKIVSEACGMSDAQLDVELGWKRDNEVIPFNNQVAMEAIFEMCQDKHMEIYVTTSFIQVEEDTNPDIRNLDALSSCDDNDNADACRVAEPTTDIRCSSSSQPVTFRRYPSELVVEDSTDGFESNDWKIAKELSSREDNLGRGACFENKNELKNKVKLWHIMNSRECYTKRSTKTMVYFRCSNVSCSWSLRGSQDILGDWHITKVNGPHSCANTGAIRKNRLCDSSVLVDIIYPFVNDDFEIKICDLQQMVNDEYALIVPYRKTWLAKEKLIENMFGTHESAFQKLPCLMTALSQSNPGMVFDYEWKEILNENEVVFGKWFWAFGPSIKGFAHCRPLISIDAIHLYGKYVGKLLIAVGYDANSHIFPLCYALMDVESVDNWTWFLNHLRCKVTMDQRKVCIISYCHADIKTAFAKVFPEPWGVHRYCARHLTNSFNTQFKDEDLMSKFSEMVLTTSTEMFDRLFNSFRNMNDDGQFTRWFTDCGDFSLWSQAYDAGYRYGIMTTNLTEELSKFLKGTQALPVIAVVNLIFERLNKHFVDCREQYKMDVAMGHEWLENVRDLLASTKEDSSLMEATMCSYGEEYRVMSPDKRQYTVNLVLRTCDCASWTLFHHPCSHAMTAIRAANMDYNSFVDPFFGLEAYRQTYSPVFHPLSNEDSWDEWNGPVVLCHSQTVNSKRGRETAQNHNEMDSTNKLKKNRCGKCDQLGHNKRSCKS